MSENEHELPAHNTFDPNFVGDANFTKVLNPYSDPLIMSHSAEYKISYAPTMESQIRKLRLSLETYRDLMLHANSVLLWEKPWHPYALTGGCTAVFMLMWLSDPNILTVLSLLGLAVTIADYILPSLISNLFKHELWSMEKQSKYEEICTSVIIYKTKLELLATSYYRMRVTNSKLYFGITMSALSVLAWIGGTINNLFLVYLLVLFTLLLPGMSNNGMLNKASEALSKIFSDLVENAKSKVGQKKIE